ncbi:MAG: MFS transporter [Anaerolineae bacterium]|nr:MFS transporter [Anaerolineae bacterium]
MISSHSHTDRRISVGRMLFPLGLGTALSLMGDATLYTVLPTHTADAGITLAGVGILLGINRAVRLFTNGPAGIAYDRFPRRWLFLSALFLGALSTAVYAATQGFWPLLAGRLLWGIAWSGIWVGGATMIMDVAATQERGRWTGLYQIWFFGGGAIGALGGGVLTDLLGYAPAMWIGSALTAVGGLVALFLLPETSGVRELAAANRVNNPHTSGPELVSAKASRLELKSNGELKLAVTLQGVNRFVVSGVISGTIGLMIQDWLQSTGVALGVATVTGIVMAGRTLLGMVAAPLAGTLSDRKSSRWTVVTWSLVIGATGMGLLAWGGPVSLLAGVGTVAISSGSLQSLATALTGDSTGPSQRGRAIGLLYTAGDFGSAIGPSMAYALLPLIGLRTIYLLCGVLFLISLSLVLGFFVRQRAHMSATQASRG